MSLLVKNATPLQYYKRLKRNNIIASYRHFRKVVSKDKRNTESNPSENISDVTKSIYSKFGKQLREQEKQFYTYKTKQKLQTPSGYQHVKLQLRQCKSADEVMRIMMDYRKCEDVQLGTAAMKSIKILHENRKVPREVAMKQINKIWNVMNEYVVGMDCAAYNEYFHACNVIRFDGKCQSKLDQMINDKITPNGITLNILLGGCRKKGDIKYALDYWKLIVTDFEQVTDAHSWSAFLAVCASAKDVELAEECYGECPYKNNVDVCYRMMSVYKNVSNVDKVLELRKYMEEEQIEIDVRIYNTMADAHKEVEQWQEAINVVKEAMLMNKWDVITVKHLFEANIGLIKMTDDFMERKQILKYIESNVVDYFKETGGQKTLESARHANRMLDAYVSTYHSFGSVTFEECRNKYNLQYWGDVGQFQVPTVDLYGHNYSVAKVILEYIFDTELDVFRDLGLNILIMDDSVKRRFDAVNQNDINSILSSLPTPLIAIQKKADLLYISSEQTKSYKGDDDDDGDYLFGV